MSKYRQLQGLANNIAQVFATSAEHFAYLSLANKEPRIEVDLLSGSIVPALFDTWRNHQLTDSCQHILTRMLDRFPPGRVRAAKLVAVFRQHNDETDSGCNKLPSAEFTVEFIDDKDRPWVSVMRVEEQPISD